MATLHTQALLLRARDVGESDRIVQLLTPATGRISVVAKGARRSVKRSFGTLDLFNLMRVQIEQRRPQVLARLEQARLVRAYHGLREHPARFALACYLLEMLNRLAPESGARAEHERLFRFAGRALAWLDAAAPRPATRPLLEFRTLDALGLRPELARCVRCGARIEPRDGPRVAYRISDGGPLCASCHAGSHAEVHAPPAPPWRSVAGGRAPDATRNATGSLHIGTLRALEDSLKVPLAELPRLAFGTREVAEATSFLQRFLHFHVGLELRSERFLAQVTQPLPAENPPPAARSTSA